MTQVVTVQTDFVDLNQMTQGLMERVHETHVILTGPDGIDEGEWVQFAVNLQDGTPGFAGLGRCVRSVDNGDARLPHQRFDLVLDSLQFDQHGQDVYQYILMSRQALHPVEGEAGYEDDYAGDEPVAIAADEATEVADSMPSESVSMDDLSGDTAGAYDDDDTEDATRVESAQHIAADLAAANAGAGALPEDPHASTEDASFEADFASEFASEPPMSVDLSETEAEAGALEGALPEGTFDEPAVFNEPAMDEGEFGAAPEPQHAPPPVIDPGERRFVYTNGLPLPNVPPRPDIDPGLRVTPAPRPAGASTAHQGHDDVDAFEAHAQPAEEPNGVVNGHSVPPEYEERPARETAQDDPTDSTYPGP